MAPKAVAPGLKASRRRLDAFDHLRGGSRQLFDEGLYDVQLGAVHDNSPTKEGDPILGPPCSRCTAEYPALSVDVSRVSCMGS